MLAMSRTTKKWSLYAYNIKLAISDLYPLVSGGEGAGSGASWGFVYTKEKIVLAKGMLVDLIHP